MRDPRSAIRDPDRIHRHSRPAGVVSERVRSRVFQCHRGDHALERRRPSPRTGARRRRVRKTDLQAIALAFPIPRLSSPRLSSAETEHCPARRNAQYDPCGLQEVTLQVGTKDAYPEGVSGCPLV